MNFKEIIKNNSLRIKSIIRKITNEENEDLEQEVYMRALSSNYKEKGSFGSWINMIAKNVSFDYIKKKKIKTQPLNSVDIQSGEQSFELKLIQKERQKRILNEINNLKPKLREVIVLTEFYNLSYEDCAKKLKCPLGTIKSRIFNAKKELAEKLKDLL